jgi:hypothetical protein
MRRGVSSAQKRRRITPWIDAAFLACVAYGCATTGMEKWACDNEDHQWGHEMPFAKQSFITQVWFTNPAANGMDVRPYENLNERERKEARRFCDIRYGLDDMNLCFQEMVETSSW